MIGGLSKHSPCLQGTNAHAILQQAPARQQLMDAAKAAPWQRKRFWFAPVAHALLHTALAWRASATGLSVALQTHTSHAALAYLNDHQIQVSMQAGISQGTGNPLVEYTS